MEKQITRKRPLSKNLVLLKPGNNATQEDPLIERRLVFTGLFDTAGRLVSGKGATNANTLGQFSAMVSGMIVASFIEYIENMELGGTDVSTAMRQIDTLFIKPLIHQTESEFAAWKKSR